MTRSRRSRGARWSGARSAFVLVADRGRVTSRVSARPRAELPTCGVQPRPAMSPGVGTALRLAAAIRRTVSPLRAKMSNQSEVEAVIRALEDERMQREVLAGDVGESARTAARRTTSSTCTPPGTMTRKIRISPRCATPSSSTSTWSASDERIIVHGDVAYITGRHIGMTILAGQPRLIDSFYLADLERSPDGAWRFCAWQSTAYSPTARR